MKNLFISRKFHSLLGMGISGVILAWLLWSMEWGKVHEALSGIYFWPFLPAALVFTGHMLLRALRWRYLLPEGRKIPIAVLFDAFMIGNLATYVLPLRAGEFIRPFILTRKKEIPFSTTFTSIVIERFFDLSVVLLSFAIMIFYVPDVPVLVFQGAFALGVVAAAILLFMIAGALFPHQVMRVARPMFSILPSRIHTRLDHFIEGLLAATVLLRDMRRLAAVIFFSILIWAVNYFFYQICAGLFGIWEPMWLGVAVGVITALAVAAPSAPGFVGVYEAGCIAGLVLFGIPQETGAAFAILTHAFQFVLVIAVGFFSLFRNNLSFSDLKSTQPREM